MTILKMDKASLAMLIATATIGADVFALKKKGEEVSGRRLAESVHEAGYNITNQFFENDQKADVSDEEYLVLLAAVRAAFEGFIQLNEGTLSRLLGKYKKASEYNRIGLVNTTHVILDFLECHANDKVAAKWKEVKKDVAVKSFNKTSEEFSQISEAFEKGE